MSVFSTFFPNSIGYTSVCKTGESCPPYVIASVARDRVAPDVSIGLPEGYTKEVLDSVAWLTGYIEKPTQISGRQASELREIGQQILELDLQSQIQPPLNIFERQSIEHLLRTVPSETAV